MPATNEHRIWLRNFHLLPSVRINWMFSDKRVHRPSLLARERWTEDQNKPRERMVGGRTKAKKGYSNPSNMKPRCHSYLLPFIRRRLVRWMVSIKKKRNVHAKLYLVKDRFRLPLPGVGEYAEKIARSYYANTRSCASLVLACCRCTMYKASSYGHDLAK